MGQLCYFSQCRVLKLCAEEFHFDHKSNHKMDMENYHHSRFGHREFRRQRNSQDRKESILDLF